MPAYKLQGRRKWRGLEISIENRKGSYRSWKDGDREGRTLMRWAYGYIRRTKAADGDHVDVYLGPDPDGAEYVYIVRQRKAPEFRVYDEDKCMIGWPSEASARRAYIAQYDDPRFLGSIDAVPVDRFVANVQRTFEQPGKVRKAMPRPPGAGWQAIPGGRGHGWRRRKAGGGWDYRYPKDWRQTYRRNPKTKPLTVASDAAEDYLRSRSRAGDTGRPEFAPADVPLETPPLPDYTDEIGEPEGWLPMKAARRIAREQGVTVAAVYEPGSAMDPRIGPALDAAWDEHIAGLQARTQAKKQIALAAAIPMRDAERKGVQESMFGQLSAKRPVYYASGSNHAGEIKQLAAMGYGVGVAAPEVNAAAERELHALAGKGVPVFVDSGAFSEVEFPKNGPPRVKNPISDTQWRTRLELFRRLASSLGPQLSVVAPDMVGNQGETLRRLARYKGEVAALDGLGARVLVPLQRGAMPLTTFEDAVRATLGDVSWTPAIPLKAAATRFSDLERWISERQPADVHLLGVGDDTPQAERIDRMIARVSPKTRVTRDSSSTIKANVGSGEAPSQVAKQAKRAEAKRAKRAEIDAKYGGGLFGKAWGQLIKKIQTRPSGAGWQPVRNSKSGGWRKLVGGRWIYWYPGEKTRKRQLTLGEVEPESQLDLFDWQPPKRDPLADLRGRAEQYKRELAEWASLDNARDRHMRMVGFELDLFLEGLGVPHEQLVELQRASVEAASACFDLLYPLDARKMQLKDTYYGLSQILNQFEVDRMGHDPVEFGTLLEASEAPTVEDAYKILQAGGIQALDILFDELVPMYAHDALLDEQEAGVLDGRSAPIREGMEAQGLNPDSLEDAKLYVKQLGLEHPDVIAAVRPNLANVKAVVETRVIDRRRVEIFEEFAWLDGDDPGLHPAASRLARAWDQLSEPPPGPSVWDRTDYGSRRSRDSAYRLGLALGHDDATKYTQPLLPSEAHLAPWGQATSYNDVAVRVSRLGDHGRYRPLDNNMELLEGPDAREKAVADLQELQSEGSNIQAQQALALTIARFDQGTAKAKQRYVHAQEQLAASPRTAHPKVFRGLSIDRGALAALEVGGTVPLTGCTAFSFSERVAREYMKDNQRAGRGNVLIELERDDTFDLSVAGWAPPHRNQGPDEGPAYEVVTGANALEVLEISKPPKPPPGNNYLPIKLRLGRRWADHEAAAITTMDGVKWGLVRARNYYFEIKQGADGIWDPVTDDNGVRVMHDSAPPKWGRDIPDAAEVRIPWETPVWKIKARAVLEDPDAVTKAIPTRSRASRWRDAVVAFNQAMADQPLSQPEPEPPGPLEKAWGQLLKHKYIRRTGTPGNYRYQYGPQGRRALEAYTEHSGETWARGGRNARAIRAMANTGEGTSATVHRGMVWRNADLGRLKPGNVLHLGTSGVASWSEDDLTAGGFIGRAFEFDDNVSEDTHTAVMVTAQGLQTGVPVGEHNAIGVDEAEWISTGRVRVDRVTRGKVDLGQGSTTGLIVHVTHLPAADARGQGHLLKAWGPLIKHKYIRRIPTGNPKRPWRYIYAPGHEPKRKTWGQQKVEIKRGKQFDLFDMTIGQAMAVKDKPYRHMLEVEPDKPWTQPDWTPDLESYSHIVINSSAGKDSQAQLDRVVKLCDKRGIPRDRIVVVHSDLGRVEWEETAELAKLQAEHYGVRFEVVRNPDGDLLEGVMQRFDRLRDKKRDGETLKAAGYNTWADLEGMTKEQLAEIIGEPAHERSFEPVKRARLFLESVADRQKTERETDAKLVKRAARLAASTNKKVQKLQGQIQGLEEKREKRGGTLTVKQGERLLKYRAQLIEHRQELAAKLEAIEAERPTGEIDFGAVVAWPSSAARWCTSDWKTRQVRKLYTRLAGEHRAAGGGQAEILSCLGIRAQESPERAKKKGFKTGIVDTGNQRVDEWYPIFGWSEDKVWDTIDESGVPYHDAYDKGMGRLSCVFCVFAPDKALGIAAKQNPALFKKYLAMEQRVHASFQPDKPLSELRDRLRDLYRNPMTTLERRALQKSMEALDMGPLVEALVVGLTLFEGPVQVDWKDGGACVHLSDPQTGRSPHIAWLDDAVAGAGSLVAYACAQAAGVEFVENGAPPPSH